MSRLDDELRKAFRRDQPSIDFTARLLERVALQPAPKARWWQRLATLLDPPKLRWVAIGVTASLLLAIGAAQYRRMHQVAVDDNGKVAQTSPSPEASSQGTANRRSGPPSQVAPITIPKSPQTRKRVAPSYTNHRLALARLQKERELKAEGEAAKEKLMFALAIASSALSDAQKAVHDDGLKP